MRAVKAKALRRAAIDVTDGVVVPRRYTTESNNPRTIILMPGCTRDTYQRTKRRLVKEKVA